MKYATRRRLHPPDRWVMPVRTSNLAEAPWSEEHLGIDVNQGVIGDSDGGHTMTNGKPKAAVRLILARAGERTIVIEDFPRGFRKAEFGFLHALLEEMGARVVRVPSQFTSQRCSSCGHTARENRPARRVFRCMRCGHEAHADVNAARNIAARAEQAQDAGGVRRLGKGLSPTGR